ncbi:endolytic transglycosylase MltG [Streptomyces sp. Ru73]|uniref:endolytic transglycosylase MltG n=1 Tax=Streptomyces sp. Ru73 TaxID=2080748 RepID=UPI000CDD5B0C|nr:endolytic transglycosylase MltG [Streptomyces sp. Ru73]POX39654.1 endolytic transglycosylase MltG [Streptomyces sp. Ru73]
MSDVHDTQHSGDRRRARITRRGRLFLTGGAVLVVGIVLLLVLLPGDERTGRAEKLTLPEGRRASQAYTAIDKALQVAPGTTEKAAKRAATARNPAKRLRLPAEAKGNPEGYLYPATYPVEDDTTPKSLLSFMVNTARQKYAADGLPPTARPGGLSAYETVVVASVVQAEADTPRDMGKVARVVRNRLAKGMPLQMDSTLNYALGRSSLHTSHADTRTDSPYNTYRHKGLPPTPIGNPGQDATRAAISPPKGDWLYFVTVRPGDTRFTADYEEHRRNVQEFNEAQKKGSG